MYVKAVKPSKEGEKDNLDKAICETLKYSVKPSDIAKDDDGGDWLHEMTKQTNAKYAFYRYWWRS